MDWPRLIRGGPGPRFCVVDLHFGPPMSQKNGSFFISGIVFCGSPSHWNGGGLHLWLPWILISAKCYHSFCFLLFVAGCLMSPTFLAFLSSLLEFSPFCKNKNLVNGYARLCHQHLKEIANGRKILSISHFFIDFSCCWHFLWPFHCCLLYFFWIFPGNHSWRIWLVEMLDDS